MFRSRSCPRGAMPPRTRLTLTTLESRDCPATLDIVGGVLTFTGDGAADMVTVSVVGSSYVIKDAGHTIANSVGFGSGWSGFGTDTVIGPTADVSSIEVYGGDGADVINIKSIVNPIMVDGQGGNDTINLSSDGASLTGNLNGIGDVVTVTNSGGLDVLNVCDYSATSGNNDVQINANSITGLAPNEIDFSGNYSQLHVFTSNSSTLAETVTVNAPNASLRLDTNGGPDSVTVAGLTFSGAVYLGAGNDTIEIDGTSGNTVSVNGGIGSNSFSVLGDATGNLIGSTSADSFYVAAGVTLMGNINGLGGGDTFDIQGTVTGTVV